MKVCSRGHKYEKLPCPKCWPSGKRKPIIAVTTMDAVIEELVRKSDKRVLVIWARDCAKRTIPYFESQYPSDKRPNTAIHACSKWIKDGVFRMKDIRKASLDSHAAARSATNESARAAARSCGQAIATIHAKLHALAAARYAVSAIRDSSASPEVASLKERNWQYKHLLKLLK